MRDPEGDAQSETRQMAESDQRGNEEKVMPYVVTVMVIFVLAVVVIIATR